MAADPERLLALAEAIADGRSSDWAAAESGAESDAELALVRELRLLAGVADVHRTAAAEGPAAGPDAGHPSRWGVLEIREPLGAGTFGSVYRAWDPRLAREVALKLLHGGGYPANVDAVEEGRLLARVRHPHVITVFGADQIDGRVGIWMELVRGRTVADLLREHGPFSAREAASIGAELCGALAAVHRAGLVHRDVKAQNVMREAGGRLVLMDFGAGEELTGDGRRTVRAGTPLYMAPELFDGSAASAQSDVYSLGVLLFHIVTGGFPVGGASAAELREAHARGDRRRLIDLRPDLPRAFVQAVDCALSRDPAERFATAGAMESALSRAFEPAVSAPDQAVASAERRRRLRRRAAAAGGAFAALAAAVVFSPGLRARVTALFTPPVKTVVVLPLANPSKDPANEYFAEGVTEILMNRLAMLKPVRVIARASVAALPAGPNDPATLRARLGAEYVVEGSVQRQDGRIRVTARLMQASSGTLLWADTFERPLGDQFALQGEIAAAIGGRIVGRLDPAAVSRIRAPQTTSTEAQEAYLQARHLVYRYNVARAVEARGLLERAVDIDPAYAAAHAGLARIYGLLLEYNLGGAAELQPLAIAAARRAVALSPDLPEANVADADTRFRYAHDWEAADAAYRRALALAPHAGFVVSPYSRFLCAQGRLDEGLELARAGAAGDPLSGDMVSTVGVAHYYRREYDEAIARHESALRIAPSYGPAYLGLARAYSSKGDYPRAIEFVKKAQAAVGDHASYRAELARNYVLAGWRDLGDQTLGGLLLEARDGAPTSFEGIGFVYAALGDRDRAFEWLNRAMDRYFARLLFIKVDPRVDPLRDDPRFGRLLERIGLHQ